jgi:hypothetical protein
MTWVAEPDGCEGGLNINIYGVRHSSQLFCFNEKSRWGCAGKAAVCLRTRIDSDKAYIRRLSHNSPCIIHFPRSLK